MVDLSKIIVEEVDSIDCHLLEGFAIETRSNEEYMLSVATSDIAVAIMYHDEQIGFATAKFEGDLFRSSAIYVDHNYRNANLAKYCVNGLIDVLKEEGAKGILADTMLTSSQILLENLAQEWELDNLPLEYEFFGTYGVIRFL